MLLNFALLAVATVNPATAPAIQQGRSADGPSVEVWTNHDDVYQRGDRVRVYFRASEDGYITVFRIDTDGRVRVLYPTEPWQDNYARADKEYEVRNYADKYAFTIDDYPGEGYVFAVASRDPFSYGALVRGDHWDYRQIAEGGRVTGDPYVALTDLVDRIVPANYSEYTYDVQPYSVEQHYQYPRFLCYDCHSYASYPYWNPYSYSCFRFRIVIYDDYFYRPRRDFRGQRVIYRSAPRLAPRYVFKDRGQSEPYVTNVRERPVDQAGRRVVDHGVTSRDLGGGGRVPVPVTNGNSGRRPSTSSDGANSGGGNSGRRAIEPGGANVDRRPNVEPRPGEIGNRRAVEGNPNEQPVRRPNEGGATDQNDGGRRANPNDRPGRQADPGSSQSGDNGKPTSVIPPARTGDQERPQPKLERRDPRREPDRPDTRNEPRPEPARQPDRQPERPRVERQPEQRQPEQRQPEKRQPEARQPEPKSQPRQPEAKQEPPRRAEPRSEPRRAPAEKPKDPDRSSRRMN